MKTHSPISAAAIIIRLPTADPHAGLRRLISEAGPSKHDRATVFIIAAITEGINTGPAIRELGGQLGLDPSHVAIILHRLAGDNPERHWWRRGSNGAYSLLT
ncbi:hypothetical protein [Sphingomonas sp. CV7422]|uniref:hypothetical protein n=1 Tax=Sphingomonas sp. CV7422 TaxID=3018036 RepID=UPI0022FE23BA|nr:hypothetical protein [Sphingomonas sp. CV7422]